LSTYLSVDLDFWSQHNDTKSATRFFRRVQGLNVPVTFFIEHDEMVQDIKKVKELTPLYNVDYHSDIIAHKERGDYAEDYNWANFIPGSKKADYTWILPNRKCYNLYEGLCHGDGIDPFDEPEKSGWKSCTVDTMSKINWKNIVRVGVCISPIYITVKTVAPVLRKYDISRQEIEHLIGNQPSAHRSRQRGMIKAA